MGGLGEGPAEGVPEGRPLLEGEAFELVAVAVDLPLEQAGVKGRCEPGSGTLAQRR